jgi:hypothetical protein
MIMMRTACITPDAFLSGRYAQKLREELEDSSYEVFHAVNERERIKSVLADLSKTSSDFSVLASKALEQLSSGILPRLRSVAPNPTSRKYAVAGQSGGCTIPPSHFC